MNNALIGLCGCGALTALFYGASLRCRQLSYYYSSTVLLAAFYVCASMTGLVFAGMVAQDLYRAVVP